jgi:hypothetical protein
MSRGADARRGRLRTEVEPESKHNQDRNPNGSLRQSLQKSNTSGPSILGH